MLTKLRKYRKGLLVLGFLCLMVITHSRTQQSEIVRVQTRQVKTSERSFKVNVSYYHLSPNRSYSYQFHFEMNENASKNHRLMILLGAETHTCDDWRKFSVLNRTLSMIRIAGFSILAICSSRMSYDVNVPLQENQDVQWMYKSLQKWMQDVYHATFNQYPRLYLHGQSRGAHFAGLLCRVLPVQGQILTVFPGHSTGMTIRSDYDQPMQTRLIVDPEFANWFYFDYCYRTNPPNVCPFQKGTFHFNSVPPSYFIHAFKDVKTRVLSEYKKMISEIKADSFKLGGILLTHNNTLKLHVVQPLQITPTYMQYHFNRWNSKPHASKLFYEHMIEFDMHRKYLNGSKVQPTFWCSLVDFTFYIKYPNLTSTWPKKKQAEYYDYARDINDYFGEICEEVCGDLLAHHAMLSRNIDMALIWLSEMDTLRSTLKISDLLDRSLRLWMYDKDSLTRATKYHGYDNSEHLNCKNKTNVHQMYAPEFFLQDYLHRLNKSRSISRHNLVWSDNPLLADYFIVPNDLYCFHFEHGANTHLSQMAYEDKHRRLNQDYFEPLLTNVRHKFPYWNMTSKAGSNHIIPFIGPSNMGKLYRKTQYLLENTIQLGLTGFRQDLLPPNSPPRHFRRNMTPIYRHGYDVLLPPFMTLRYHERNLSMANWYEKKMRLLYFVGTVNHSNSLQSPRFGLLSLARDISTGKHVKYKSTITIGKKEFETLIVIDGELSHAEYSKALRSSVFGLCPEGHSLWSLRLYETMLFGAIPVILADGIVLPFERFIDWRSFSQKINGGQVKEIIDLTIGGSKFEQRVIEKMHNMRKYSNAFQWPYSAVDREHRYHTFLPQEDSNSNGTVIRNVFHFLSLELRCRRLEQLYGLTSATFSIQSMEARRRACKNHRNICPCFNERMPIAFDQYN